MGRPLKPINLLQQERARNREIRRLRQQVRRLENNVIQQRPYRGTPNTEGVDPGTPWPTDPEVLSGQGSGQGAVAPMRAEDPYL